MIMSDSVLRHIERLKRSVFTSQEISTISGKSPSTTVQALNHLQKQDVIKKVYRGIWIKQYSSDISPYAVVPYLLPRHQVYVSFISALHLYDIIEQIPQVITIATITHSKIIKTEIGTYKFHRITPAFFQGFKWYKGVRSFLIAEPEKALVDCLYISTRKNKQYGYFPELHFDRSFSIKRLRYWMQKIPFSNIKSDVRKKVARIQVIANNGVKE